MLPELADFPARTTFPLRYSDTDRQGHINNTVFATMLEAARVELVYGPGVPPLPPGTSFVIARLVIDFRAELEWPGEVTIGTRVTRIGTSSVTLDHAVFRDAALVATGEGVMVMLDGTTRRAAPLPPVLRDHLATLEARGR
jgi:acyl-CoA thioester hydrolase